jgi:ribosome maturation factor RimP
LTGALGRIVVLKWGAVAPAFFVAVFTPNVTNGTPMTDAAPGGLAADIERQVGELGYELVELEVAGNRARPILRVYIDRPGSVPGEPAVSLDDCTAVSRGLEPMLDAYEGLSDRYVLEVSSPGVERPLVRPRDWSRFAGQEVSVRGRAALAGKARRLDGELLGTKGDEGNESVRLRLAGGEEVEFPLAEVEKAHLVYRWGGKQRG